MNKKLPGLIHLKISLLLKDNENKDQQYPPQLWGQCVEFERLIIVLEW